MTDIYFTFDATDGSIPSDIHISGEFSLWDIVQIMNTAVNLHKIARDGMYHVTTAEKDAEANSEQQTLLPNSHNYLDETQPITAIREV